MLRILELYYEPLPSGQTTHVLSLTGGLIQRGHTVTVVLPEYLKTTIVAFEHTGAQVKPLPLRKVLWKPAAVVGLTRLIRDNGFDIIHIHSQEAGITGRLIARLAGAKRIVYTPQTIDIRQAGVRRLYELLERALASLTNRIISVNHVDRERLINWGIPEHKVVTISNGVETHPRPDPRSLAELKAIAGVPEGHPIVMQLGRLTVQKDPIAFVEGAALIHRELPETHFVMVGEGPLLQAVRDKVRSYKLETYFHLTGRVENAAALLQIADLVTLTSRWEGLPYSILEAMAYGKPFITTDVNGIRDLVACAPGGRAVPAGDMAAWAQSVVDLLNAPDQCAELGRLGKQRLIETYALSLMVERIEQLYFELAAGE